MTSSLNRLLSSVLLGASLLCVLATTGCGETAHEHEEHGRFPVTQPLVQDAELTREYVAQVHAIQHIEVRALERGYLQDTFVDEGRPVAEGERMFQITPSLYRAELQQAQAEADVADIELRTTQSLRDRDVVSSSELAMAQARRERASAERSMAQTHLDFTQIRAPFAGIMGLLEVRKGSLLEEGELLTTLSDNSVMWVYFNVSESEYIDYSRRMRVEDQVQVGLRLANGEMFEHLGVIETIAADFNNETGNIAFRASFPNPQGLLRHGETGKVVISSPVVDALLIPQKATFDILDKKYVYVVDDEHQVHQREITVSAELPHVYLVMSGVTADDHILLEGLRKVRDGHEVDVDYQDPTEVMSHLELHAE